MINDKLLKNRREEGVSGLPNVPQDDCRLARMLTLALFEISTSDNVELKRDKFAVIWDSSLKKKEFVNELKEAIIPVLQKWLC